MKAAEFSEKGAIRRGGLDGAHLNAEVGHTRADRGLGNGGDDDHESNAEAGGSGERGEGAGAKDTGSEKDDAVEDSSEVHRGEGIANDGTGLVAAVEDAERAGSDNEAEEHVGAEPQAESEKLKPSQEGAHWRVSFTEREKADS